MYYSTAACNDTLARMSVNPEEKTKIGVAGPTLRGQRKSSHVGAIDHRVKLLLVLRLSSQLRKVKYCSSV